jgi:hypothetical protein
MIANDPSPSEIRETCREIQSGWNPSEERWRRLLVSLAEAPPEPWQSPEILVDGVLGPQKSASND